MPHRSHDSGRLLMTAQAVAATLASSAALASDFNFTVPISATNLPAEVVSMQVNCAVLRDDRFIIGNGHTIQPVRGGAFSGEVRVGVDVVGPDKLRAATYTCELHSFQTAATAASAARDYTADGGLAPLPHASGAPFQVRISGPLPAQPRPPQPAPSGTPSGNTLQVPALKGLPRPAVPTLPK